MFNKDVNKVVYKDRTYYHSTVIGKKLFVEERLKPLILSMNTCWDDVKYIQNSHKEVVRLVNKNDEKTIEVNVACDSIEALTKDVFRKIMEVF